MLFELTKTTTNLCEDPTDSKLKDEEGYKCKLCPQNFDASLQQHEACFHDQDSVKYLDKIGKGSVFECPNCYRNFSNINDMKIHKNAMHSSQRVFSQQRCFVCAKLFLGRNVRDQHIITHFKSISEGIMDNVEQMHRQMGDSLMSNQCPLCSYVMSTRKSFRHHLIFQHVLRDNGALNVLLGTKAAKSEECSLVRQLLASPELLWKRGPLRTQSFPVVNPVNEIPKSRLKKAKREKVEIPQVATISTQETYAAKYVVNTEAGTLSDDSFDSGKVFAVGIIKVEIIEKPSNDLSANEEEPWMKLKTLLSKKCLEKCNSANYTPFKCKICGEVYPRLFSFEVHLAEKHLDVALEETS